MIDLHSHTTASDGQYTPVELVERAAKAGLKVLAITDHDTVAGIAPASIEAARHGLRLIPGIEVSAFINDREVHILGHFLDTAEARLAGFAELLRGERDTRMEQMVAKAQALGFPVTMAQVRGLAGGSPLTRPHLARVLVELGYCSSTRDAFDRFLKDRGPMWVERYKLTAEDAIALIHGAGGVATLAHPGPSKVERHELEQLRKAGLDGLEVAHSDHPPSLREKLLVIASDLGLVPTAGSDFHGEKVAPDRELGSTTMAQAQLDALEARRPSARA